MSERDPDDAAISRLYQQASTGEPPRALDNAIIEAARRSAGATRPRRQVWWRFAAPAAVLATGVLAMLVSLTVQREPEVPPAGVPAEQPPAPLERREPAAATVAKPPADEVVRPSPPRSAAKRDVAPAASAAAPSRGETLPAAAPRVESAPPPAPLAADSSVAARPERLAPPAPAAAPSGAPLPSAAPLREAVEAKRAAEPEARGQRAAAAGQDKAKAEHGTAAIERATPEAWLNEIRRLRREGRRDEADRLQAEFARSYPDYRLPDDLRR